MKIDTVKLILAIALALVLGFVCEIIAPETEGRNWISLAVGSISIASVLIPAMGLKYENARRGVSIRVLSWIMAVLLVADNMLFSSHEYKIDAYIAVTLLIAIISWVVIYAMYSAKSK